MTKSIDLIAILRSGEHASAVWHVDVGPSTPLMRLCGAWVTNDTKVLSNVLASRAILPFGGKLDAEQNGWRKLQSVLLTSGQP